LSKIFGSGSDSDTIEIFRSGSDYQISISAQHWKLVCNNKISHDDAMDVMLVTDSTFTPLNKKWTQYELADRFGHTDINNIHIFHVFHAKLERQTFK